jgi:hypothetical protein
MWKYLNESVQGTSHRQTGTVCQDASFVTPYRVDGDEVLIVACADGAGSANEAQVGSARACATIVNCATTHFEAGRILSEVTNDTLREWMRELHGTLVGEAQQRGITLRDLACTLLFAVIGGNRAVFIQIGDGAIVTLQDDKYCPVFWPQSGEYQNTTFFVTDEEYEQRFQSQVMDKSIIELAMFTDGLQMLSLNYATKTAHDPFFKPMFDALRAVADRQDLVVPMTQFLDSKHVNDRTDDDKTLILATRVPSADATI